MGPNSLNPIQDDNASAVAWLPMWALYSSHRNIGFYFEMMTSLWEAKTREFIMAMLRVDSDRNISISSSQERKVPGQQVYKPAGACSRYK